MIELIFLKKKNIFVLKKERKELNIFYRIEFKIMCFFININIYMKIRLRKN